MPNYAPEAATSESGTAKLPIRMGELPHHVGYLLRRAQVAVFSGLADELAPFALRPVTFSVLVVIDANSNLSQTAVGQTLGIQRANLVPLVSELEQRGLIVRNPSATDGRAHVLRLTSKGRGLLRRARVRVAGHEAQITARVGTQGRALLLSLLGVLVALNGVGTPPAASQEG